MLTEEIFLGICPLLTDLTHSITISLHCNTGSPSTTPHYNSSQTQPFLTFLGSDDISVYPSSQ
jgi:hypothetical protein